MSHDLKMLHGDDDEGDCLYGAHIMISNDLGRNPNYYAQLGFFCLLTMGESTRKTREARAIRSCESVD